MSQTRRRPQPLGPPHGDTHTNANTDACPHADAHSNPNDNPYTHTDSNATVRDSPRISSGMTTPVLYV